MHLLVSDYCQCGNVPGIGSTLVPLMSDRTALTKIMSTATIKVVLIATLKRVSIRSAIALPDEKSPRLSYSGNTMVHSQQLEIFNP